jgi:hypothetical protein
MRRKRQIEVFSISFLDLLSGALGAVIILYVAIPKNLPQVETTSTPIIEEQLELAKKNNELTQVRELLKQTNDKLMQLEATHKAGPEAAKFDVGFSFKGKNIIFIIDTSYSMTEEDRMGQVKAGLKMLITSLPKDYSFDIIHYPFEHRAPFKTLFGDFRENTQINREDMFNFLYRLRPYGGTPTREVLLFALQNYEKASDIVLLSDGVPTLHNSNKKDDIFDILRVVREENPHKVQINSIGVGSDFTHSKDNPHYQFMKLLSEEHGGFFVGF